MPFTEEVVSSLDTDADAIIGRYPRSRSALLPLLHLVQSQEGYVSEDGIGYCATKLGLSKTEVTGVASFYTQYRFVPGGEYNVGVCTNTLCAVMGGDQIYAELTEHLGGGHDQDDQHGQAEAGHGVLTTEDGKVTLQRIECNAACDYAPVVMVNWEFFDNMTPDSAKALVDDLQAGTPVRPTRGPDRLCTWREVSRVLAGFDDGLAHQGPSAGAPSLVGLKLAKERGWQAPEYDSSGDGETAGSPAREQAHEPAGLGSPADHGGRPGGGTQEPAAAGSGAQAPEAGRSPEARKDPDAGNGPETGSGPETGNAPDVGSGPETGDGPDAGNGPDAGKGGAQ